MFNSIDKFSLYLIKPDGTELGELNYNNLEVYLSGVNEVGYMSFKIPEVINNNEGLTKTNPYYTAIKPSFRVRLEIDNKDKGVYIREYKISRPVEKTDGTITDITYYAQSREIELSQKAIISFAGVPVNVNDSTGITIESDGSITYTPLTTSEIVDYRLDGLTIADVATSILKQTGSSWELSYVDPDLIDIYRSGFDIQGSDTLNALRDLQYTYDCVVVFDTVNKKIEYHKLDNIGNDLGLTIEYGRYLKELSKEEKVQDIVTRMRAVGADGLGIQGKTSTGKNYVENYDYFLGSFERVGSVVTKHSEWMSDDLASAILDYEQLTELIRPTLEYEFTVRDALIENKINKEQEIEYLNSSESIIEEVTSVSYSSTVGQVNLSKDSRIISSSAGIGTVEAFVGGEWVILSYQKTPNGETVSDVTGQHYRYPVNVISGDNYPDFGSSVIYVDKSEYPDGTNFRLTYDTFGLTLIYQTKNIYETRLADTTITSSEAETVSGIIDALILDETNRKLEIASAKNDLSLIQSNIDVSNDTIQTIWDLLSVENNFTEAQQEEWESFIVEGIYQNTEISDETLLFNATQDALNDAKVPELNITLSTISVLQTEDAMVDWDKINLYDFINIRFERLGVDIQARILEISYSPETYGMNLLISTTTNYIKDDNHFMARFIEKSSKSANKVDYSNKDWNGAKENTDVLSGFSDSGINTKEYNIGSANDESIKMDDNGLTIEEKFTVDSDYNPVKNVPSATSDQRYNDRIIRVGNGGIFLSKDGGQTFSTAITADKIFADVIKGTLLVGNELQILGNDGTSDIVTIGEVLGSDFGIVIDGLIDEKPVVTSMTRDKGFSINYDGDDKFFIGSDGVLNAKGLNILNSSDATMIEDGKIYANYIEGSLTIGTNLTVEGELFVGENLTIVGNDGESDVITIGEILTDDFGIKVSGIITGDTSAKLVEVLMTRDKGLEITYDGISKFFVGTDGVINAKGLNILNSSDETMLEDGKVYANYIQGTLEIGDNLFIQGIDTALTEILKIGNIAIDELPVNNDFGIKIDSIVDTKALEIFVTRDRGFKITYDDDDKFFVNSLGVLTAKGLNILDGSDDTMMEDGKIYASYIEGSLTIGSNLTVEGELVVGADLSITGNDGTNDVINIGEVLTSDFGLVVNGILNDGVSGDKPIITSVTRDGGFKINYDGNDVFKVNNTGIIQANGISLYKSDGTTLLLDKDKLVADYVQGDLLVGGNLSITGNDDISDIMKIGNVLTDDFGVTVDGVVNLKPVVVSITRDKGFTISYDSDDKFFVGTDGILNAKGLNILNDSDETMLEDGKIFANYIQGNLNVGGDLSVIGNDGTNDIIIIGEIDTTGDATNDDFGIIVSGTVNTTDVKVIMGRDSGFKIAVDSGSGYVDNFSVNDNGIIQARGIELYMNDGTTLLLDNDKLVADYVQGNLNVGGNLSVIGNDGTNDIITIGEVLTDDFGIVVNGVINTKAVVISMTRDEGFKITYNGSNKFSVDSTGELIAEGITTKNLTVETSSGKTILSNNMIVQTVGGEQAYVGTVLSRFSSLTSRMFTTSANFSEFAEVYAFVIVNTYGVSGGAIEVTMNGFELSYGVDWTSVTTKSLTAQGSNQYYYIRMPSPSVGSFTYPSGIVDVSIKNTSALTMDIKVLALGYSARIYAEMQ